MAEEFARQEPGVPIISNGVSVGRTGSYDHDLTPPDFAAPSVAPTYGSPSYGASPYGPAGSQSQTYPAEGFGPGTYPGTGHADPLMPPSEYSAFPLNAYPSPNYYASQRTNGMAVAALVTGVLFFGIFPIIFGAVALGRIRETGERGKGMAIAGLVLGLVQVGLWVVFWMLFMTLGAMWG